SPSEGQSWAVITDISVVLPAPFRPSRPCILSFSKSSVTLSRATVLLNRRVMACASIALICCSVSKVVMVSPWLGRIAVTQHGQDRVGILSTCPCFGQQGVEVVLSEFLDSLVTHDMLRSGGNEGPQTASFF